MTYIFMINDKDNKIIRWLLVDPSQRNNNITWKLCGGGAENVDVQNPLEKGNGTRIKNVNTLYKAGNKYGTLTLPKAMDAIKKEDKGMFGQYQLEDDLYYIQAQYLGKGIFENGKFKEISLNYMYAGQSAA